MPPHPAIQLLQNSPHRFARQGAVVPTWRTYQGKRLGPYYRLAYREGNQQRSIYLGRQSPLVDQVRRLLGLCQANHRFRCHARRSRAEFRKRVLRPLKQYLQDAFRLYGHGLYFKGWEIRGIRDFIAWKKLSSSLPEMPQPPAMPDLGHHLAAVDSQPSNSTTPIAPHPSTTSMRRSTARTSDRTKARRKIRGFADSYRHHLQGLLQPPQETLPRSHGCKPLESNPARPARARAACDTPHTGSRSLAPPTHRRNPTAHQSPPLIPALWEIRNFVDQIRPRPPPHHPSWITRPGWPRCFFRRNLPNSFGTFGETSLLAQPQKVCSRLEFQALCPVGTTNRLTLA